MAQLSPIFNIPFFTDDAGLPLAGGRIFTYEAGSSSVLKQTFTGPDGTIGNANPIVLNSAGQLGAGISIWLTDAEAYNLVLTAPDGTTVLKQFDNVTGVIAPVPGGETTDNPIWVSVALPGFLSTTQFFVPGNFAAEFAVGNRARITLGTGFVYGTVSAVSFSSPNTSVTLILDGGATLNGTISAADYSLLIAAGKTVDAGAVTYTSALSYTVTNTVGRKLNDTVNALNVVNSTLQSTISRNAGVQTAIGGGANTLYSISPTPAITSYASNGSFIVRFTNASEGNPTLNVNALGALPLLQFTADGSSLEAAQITPDLISTVAYAEDSWILLDRLYPTTAQPHNWAAIYGNTIFTVPAGVTSMKVNLFGGGGGGGQGYQYDDGSEDRNIIYVSGGSGGGGANAAAWIQTAPGTTYTVIIGASGLGGFQNNFTGNGTAGGTSTFGGSILICGGGGGGTNAFQGATNGSSGTVSGSAPWLPYATGTFGQGGLGGYGAYAPDGAGKNGVPGMCLIEW
jgi:hypothetical protein